ncbi:GH25 family lysozyme [Sinomonas sp. ASV322]|uniref:GH25 family lysozyme n=1 Tax=Sinomonas sp. ASV322 TaxID=3041920 RepID=UPI0027DAC627|nr:GH25 family lysozyme [Sinomonas sp. ASV322]MDQ4503240.1 GH25 family lysozyme [Sinomonas sp. ASV322]
MVFHKLASKAGRGIGVLSAIVALTATSFAVGTSASDASPTSPSPSATTVSGQPTPLPPSSASPQKTTPSPMPSASPSVGRNGMSPKPGDDARLRDLMRQSVGRGAKMGQANPDTHEPTGGPGRTMAVRVPLASTWQPSWGVSGIDVSAYQASQSGSTWTDTTNWSSLASQGVRFAYIKASEGNYYTNQAFSQQYGNSQNAGMIRGAYHFAIPNWSSGADQANYFVQNGGGWSPDGITLPPVLDIEYNPYAGKIINGVNMGDTCYSMNASQMAAWISDFSNTMLSLTGRRPAIYSTTDWWTRCTGNSSAFSANPLWIAAYNQSGPSTLPASWTQFSVWQYSSTGPFPGDSNVWNGDYSSLQRFATYGDTDPSASIGVAAGSANLGTQTSGILCTLSNGGCYQGFANGAIIWSRATGAQPSPNGPIRTAWGQSGYDSGQFGYPTSGIVCTLTNGGCYQGFQNGAIIWSQATGAQPSANGPIRTVWGQTGYDSGPLGYPTTGIVTGLLNGGTYQNYQGGAIIWSQATGAQPSPNGPIRTYWGSTGYEAGSFGYPTSGVVCTLANGGCYQGFQSGAIIWSQATGAQPSPNGPIRTAWGQTGYESGPLGYPTSGVVCTLTNAGCYQGFQNGAIVWSQATGAQASPNGPIRTLWAQTGFDSGPLGYPTAGVVCGLSNGGCYQNFQNGAIVWTQSTGAELSLNGPIRTAWAQSGYETGPLAYPTTGIVTGLINGGTYQNYQNGAIIWSQATGAQVSPNGPLRTAWAQTGYETGVMGYPTSGVTCTLTNGGCYQGFQNGAIVWSQATGAQLSPNGPIRTAWAQTGFDAGPLGYPTTGIVGGLINGGTYQNYQNGAIIWSQATGAQVSPNGPIRNYWASTGYETGRYGYPMGGQVCNGAKTNCSQAFQRGTISWDSVNGIY